MPTISNVWDSANENDWIHALNAYWEKIKPGSIVLEREMEALTPDWFRNLSAEEWRQFLATKYFKWKHTNGLYRGSVCRHFARNTLEQVARVKDELFRANLSDARSTISLVTQLHGFGPSGASGLLAIMFPNEFGTADKFLVEALRGIPGLPDTGKLRHMKPATLDVEDVTLLISILRKKALTNNKLFSTNVWTPRRIDKICWRFGHS